jgi:hypothetical protein
MKNLFANLGIVFIFVVGCGIQPNKFQGLNSTPSIAVATPDIYSMQVPTPPKFEAKISVTPAPGKSTSHSHEYEMDVTDGSGRVMTTGDGRSLYVRKKKHKSRQVIHQVKKGFWIGGVK